MKYDESDNLIIRASRTVTDKVEDAFGIELIIEMQGNGLVAYAFVSILDKSYM